MTGPQKLGETLKRKGFITSGQLTRALDQQKIHGNLIGRILVEQGFVTERDLTLCLGEQLKIPVVDFTRAPVNRQALRLVSPPYASQHLVLPITFLVVPEGEVLVVAMENPNNKKVILDLYKKTGYPIKPLLAIRSEILKAISQLYRRKS